MVISQNINERSMEYRGSKSGFLDKIIFLYFLFLVKLVKEQRVDGS